MIVPWNSSFSTTFEGSTSAERFRGKISNWLFNATTKHDTFGGSLFGERNLKEQFSAFW